MRLLCTSLNAKRLATLDVSHLGDGFVVFFFLTILTVNGFFRFVADFLVGRRYIDFFVNGIVYKIMSENFRRIERWADPVLPAHLNPILIIYDEPCKALVFYDK